MYNLYITIYTKRNGKTPIHTYIYMWRRFCMLLIHSNFNTMLLLPPVKWLEVCSCEGVHGVPMWACVCVWLWWIICCKYWISTGANEIRSLLPIRWTRACVLSVMCTISICDAVDACCLCRVRRHRSNIRIEDTPYCSRRFVVWSAFVVCRLSTPSVFPKSVGQRNATQ